MTAGELIGQADNTGIYTTGDHLHFQIKECDRDGNTHNRGNGYNGAFDPSPYFPKNWDKSNAYHRYGRKGSYLAEIKVRFKKAWLHRYLIDRNSLKLVYDNEFINGLTYGGWDIEFLMNESMYFIWAYLKKDEYEKGQIAFKR